MPTVAERLATLEQIARDNRSRIDDVADGINGGGDVPYERSMRGRMGSLENTLAAMVLRRSYGTGLLVGWQRVALVICAVATTAAAWYAALHG